LPFAAYFNDIVVGGICCREEEEKGEITLYILTIGVFEPYRKYQIGTQLIDEIEKLAKADGKIKSIYLHVQINNETAINFYKKHGFVVEELLKDYYNDIEPADCYKLKKTF
jgi:ribosomal protein S18 acetylase RimI-like enzyme